MAIADYRTDSTKGLSGLHLYHYGMSNCSQRVRLALEEKNLEWTSHYVELGELEQLEDEYQRINPKGVVPVLVHDGQIVTESLDIIAYLDEKFPEPPLLQLENVDADRVAAQLKAAQAIQEPLKILTYEFFFKTLGIFNKEWVDHYTKHQGNDKNVEFLQEFSRGFSRERIDNALRGVQEYCSKVDEAAGQSTYLAGAQRSLADIAAVVNVHRFYMLKLDVAQYDHMRRWYDKMASRPAFQKAIMSPEYVPMNG